jgi:hypothetical protein
MNDRHLDPRALEVLLNQPEIVAWLGLSKQEFTSLLDSRRQNEREPTEASRVPERSRGRRRAA